MSPKCKAALPLLLALLLLLTACTPSAPLPSLSPHHVPTAVAVSTPSPTPTVSSHPSPTASERPTAAQTTPDVSPTAPTPQPEPSTPTCTLSISCATVLDKMDQLGAGMAEHLPADGWILPPTQVTITAGESVFEVLKRTCRSQGVPLEFSLTPGLGGAYIEGIGNLYQFDCGDLSGWLYAVNGVSPNTGCSEVALSDGDTLTWCYTCDLGADLPHITRE